MKAKKTFYVTTAIDYVNAEPHIGHAYQKIVADILARWSRIQGRETFFLTGTDEHGKKIALSAEKAGKSPKEFADEMAEKFKLAWKKLNIQHDRFIRTTDKDHEKTVVEFIKKISKNKDIYKGKYEGYYCTACEAYYTEKDLAGGCCPFHNTKIEKLKEESYFFKLSKYQKFLLELYKKRPEFVLPDERRNEIINRVKEGLQDLSMTRTSFSWGIPFPLDKKHVVYVWFDALINYYTAINSAKNKKFWPADYHLLGKDNGWFHAVIWPAMLKSAGIEMPKTVFIHGFLKFNGEKISKSFGNAISPVVLAEKYGADSVRYFVMRQIPFGEDGDFDEKSLVKRHNTELADKLGNLVSRVSALAEKYGLEKTKPLDSSKTINAVERNFNNLELDKALNEIFAFIDKCNEHIQSKKPWETGDKKVLYQLANAIKDASILLSPFIPETCEKIAKTFNFDISFKELNKPLKAGKIKKSEILFKKIEENKPAEITGDSKLNKPKVIEGIATMENLIEFADWEKLDLRVAKIKKIEDMEGADKLYKLTLDVGELGEKVVCAGIKQHYKKDELKGKKLVYFSNLKPRMMKGIESHGMILAAVSRDHSKVILIMPEKDIEAGAKIS
jgi:methionyl-tRNA synthetase